MITIKKDLTDIKMSDKKKQILDILDKWLGEINKEGKEFEREFLNNKYNKYFDEIKDIIGDFKDIGDMDVLNFIGFIVIEPWKTDIKILKELRVEFQNLKTSFYYNFNKSKEVK